MSPTPFALPKQRLRHNGKAVRPEASYVVYWITAYRRLQDNFALDRAVGWSLQLKKPLLIVETLGIEQQWSCLRFHHFIAQGMQENQWACAQQGITYIGDIETKPWESTARLKQLSQEACLIISDDYPTGFVPERQKQLDEQLALRMEYVDSNGLLPQRLGEKDFPSAYIFRRFMQKNIAQQLAYCPEKQPLEAVKALGQAPISKQALAQLGFILQSAAKEPHPFFALSYLEQLPIDQSIRPALFEGGAMAAEKSLQRFLKKGLSVYHEERNQPDAQAASALSPYLRHGHISTHGIFQKLLQGSNWQPTLLPKQASGKRHGFWQLPENYESFLDELVIWRELGFNMCAFREDFAQYHSLPSWAQKTLAQHSHDKRSHLYSLQELDDALSLDAIWNAAQRQLKYHGIIQNYLRMLWGKKILEWTTDPQTACSNMIELNNRYALDGQDPNSYTGIFWILGRYDRPWVERAIFGQIRYMTSASTQKKLQLENYLGTYGKIPRC